MLPPHFRPMPRAKRIMVMSRKIVLSLAIATVLTCFAGFIGNAQARPYQRYSGYRRYSYGGSLMSRPQYPRSMRRYGMKQLGAYPALGGVRSLPFWGGER